MSKPKDGQSPFDQRVKILKSLSPEEIARNAKVLWEKEDLEKGIFRVPVLSSEIIVSYPQIEISAPQWLSGFSISLLALIYLSRANGTPPSGKWVAFRELPGGRFYEPVVSRSAEEPLANTFGANPKDILKTATLYGGTEESFGDVSVSFNLFPLVRICFVLWQKTEEFSSKCTVLFDSSAHHHLGTFDLRIGAEFISSLLRKPTS